MTWEVHIIREEDVDELRLGLDDFPGIPTNGTLLNCFYGHTWVVENVLIDTMENRLVIWVCEAAYVETPRVF